MNDSKFAERVEIGASNILFVGSPFFFPDLILRLVCQEFRGAGVLRQDSLDPPPDPVPKGLRLVILEESLAGSVAERLAGLRARLADAPITLAYQDREVARDLFARQQVDPRLEGLRFLPINAPIGGLVSMLQLLFMGEFVVPGELLAPAGTARGDAPASAPGAATVNPRAADLLTPREQQVLALVSRGARNKTIAGDLGLSEHTVKLHIHNIISKIHVGNRTEAANWYLGRSHGADAAPPAR